MRRVAWQPKHTLWLTCVVLVLAAVVLLAIFAHGQYVPELLAFAGGLLVPGSPLGGLPSARTEK